jgi:hypothetical protein
MFSCQRAWAVHVGRSDGSSVLAPANVVLMVMPRAFLQVLRQFVSPASPTWFAKTVVIAKRGLPWSMADRANVDVRLGPLKFAFCHFSSQPRI